MSARFPIPEQSFPFESYCELYNAFHNGMVEEVKGEPPVYHPELDECKKIQELGELLVFHKGSVGDNVVEGKVRDSEVAWIDDNPNAPSLDLRHWVIQRMMGILGKVNRDKFQLDLDGFDPIQYTQYSLNQHYDWHVDVREGNETNQHRKLSATVMLTGPDEYEGGELQLNIGGNPNNVKSLRPPKGTVVLFYSHLPHRVAPVTSGNRTSLVAWALGPKLR